MKLNITKNKWKASYGFAIICHPYPDRWGWDVLIGNRNYTISLDPKNIKTPNDFYNRSCSTSGHAWARYEKQSDRCIFCGVKRINLRSHDEFLDEITNNIELEDCWLALQKVVQLHGDDYGMCMTCEMKEYPCLTIRTISETVKL